MISFYPYRIYLRRALVLSLLLTLALPLLGQQKYQREIDSLEASLTQTLTDSARLKTTFELVKFYFLRGDIPRSLEYNQEAYTQSIALESSVDEADALERFGWLYSKNASYDQSIDYYQQAMVLRERLDQPRMVMFNLNAMATVYKTLSQYGEAQRMYQEVQAWGKKTADSVYWGVGLQNEASVLSTQSKYHRAIPLLRQAEALMKPIDYWHGLKYVYDNLGIAYRALGQHEEALRWYRLNEQYLLNEDEPRALARAQNNMAHLYHDRQQYDSARYYVEQAYRLRLEVKDEAGLGYSGNLLGRILTDLQKFEEARPYLEESLRIRAKREDYSLLSRTYRYLGNWYARQGDFDSALIQFDQATHYANLITDTAQQNINLRDLGDFYLQEGVYPQALEAFLTLLANEQSRSNVFFVGMAYGRLGEVLAKQEEYRDAIVYYDNAILTHQSIENRWGEADSYLALGGLYQALDQPEESIANYEKSLALRTQEGLGREAEVWQGMGEAYVAMGQLAEGRAYLQRARAQHIREQNPQGLAATYLTLARLRQMEQAITPAIGLARQGLAQAQVSRQKDLIRDAHGLLADLYREQQAFQSAYFHKSRFQEIQDSLFNEANVRQLAQLELGFAFEQEKKDLAEAQAREELQLQAEIDRRRTVQWATLGGVALLMALLVQISLSNRRQKRQGQQIAKQNEQIQTQNVALQDLNDSLTTLSKFKDTWTHMVAHDMKNSLNTIIGHSADALEDQRLYSINRSGQVMLNLVTNMLDIQKFEEASMVLTPTPVAVHTLAQKAQERVAFLYQMEEVTLELAIQQSVILEVDEELMLRVLVNLLTNAAKYSEPKGTVTLGLRVDAQGCALAVQDRGQGIAEEDLPYIFEKFWQTQSRGAGHTVSNGLGLTFCKLAVEAHGGSLSVASTLGEGTTFTLLLPTGYQLTNEPVSLDTPTGIAEPQLLTPQQAAELAPYRDQFRELKYFEVDDVLSLIESLPEALQNASWTQQIEKSVMAGDGERYTALLDDRIINC